MAEPVLPAAALADWRTRIEARLAAALPAPDAQPQRLHRAMRHAALDGGKRMRPMLVYATGTALGADIASLDAAAAAVELIHAYSLVHDDLPSMDDDHLRRGKPTVHVAFDEATAIIAGDALQALAFELLATAPVPDRVRVDLLRELAAAAGARGMCGGQALDIDATAPRRQQASTPSNAPPRAEETRLRVVREHPHFTLQDIEHLHALKTGALLRASVRMGAIVAEADAATRSHLDTFADALGLAFQIRDDLLDVEGDSATLGKTAGKDNAQDKATFPALIGIDASRARLQQLDLTMRQALAPLGADVATLAALGHAAIQRSH